MSMTQSEMIKLICKAAEKKGYPMVQSNNNGSPTLHLHLGLQNEIDDLYIDILFRYDGYVTTYAYIDQKAGDHMLEIGEFITRLNRDETFGHFNLQCDTGMIGYVVSFPFVVFENDHYYERIWAHAIKRFQVLSKPLFDIMEREKTPLEAYNEVYGR